MPGPTVKALTPTWTRIGPLHSLCDHDIGDEGAAAIAAVLPQCTALWRLLYVRSCQRMRYKTRRPLVALANTLCVEAAFPNTTTVHLRDCIVRAQVVR